MICRYLYTLIFVLLNKWNVSFSPLIRLKQSQIILRYCQLWAKRADNTNCQEEGALSKGWSWIILLTGPFGKTQFHLTYCLSFFLLRWTLVCAIFGSGHCFRKWQVDILLKPLQGKNCEKPYPGYRHSICGEYEMSVLWNQENKVWILQPYITVETFYVGGPTFWSDAFPSRSSCDVNGCLSFPFFFFLIALFLTQAFLVMGSSLLQHLSNVFLCPSSCCIGESKCTHLELFLFRKFPYVSLFALSESWWLLMQKKVWGCLLQILLHTWIY